MQQAGVLPILHVCLCVQVYVSLADMATMRDALKKESLEVETKLAYVPVDGFVTQDDLVMDS